MLEKKKVGNACRTKNQIRSSKSRGSQFEYDCQASLEQKPRFIVTRTSERGFQMQYDLRVDVPPFVMMIECKRLKGISWNQLVKFYEKLKKVTENESNHRLYILFKSNNQPCLVFSEFDGVGIGIRPFEEVFDVPFIKHKSTRAKKEEIKDGI